MSKDYKKMAAEVNAGGAQLFKGSPDVMRAYRELMAKASAAGALDTRTKELMAVAIAVSIRCEGCIVFHMQGAIKHGATREEVLETVAVAVEMGGGPATVYGAQALEAFDQLSAG